MSVGWIIVIGYLIWVHLVILGGIYEELKKLNNK